MIIENNLRSPDPIKAREPWRVEDDDEMCHLMTADGECIATHYLGLGMDEASLEEQEAVQDTVVDMFGQIAMFPVLLAEARKVISNPSDPEALENLRMAIQAIDDDHNLDEDEDEEDDAAADDDEEEIDAFFEAARTAMALKRGQGSKDPAIVVPLIKVLASQLIESVADIVATTLPELTGDRKAQAMAAIDLSLALCLSDEELRPDGVAFLGRYLKAQGNDMMASIEKHGVENPPPQKDLQ